MNVLMNVQKNYNIFLMIIYVNQIVVYINLVNKLKTNLIVTNVKKIAIKTILEILLYKEYTNVQIHAYKWETYFYIVNNKQYKLDKNKE